jgi:hypothetical protein
MAPRWYECNTVARKRCQCRESLPTISKDQPMRSSLRAAPLALALLTALPDHAQAQPKQIELRIDALSYERATGRSSIDVRFPGAAAVAWYLNNNVALETRLLGFQRRHNDGAGEASSTTSTTLTAALFAPVHFGSARGRSGLFIAPGLIVSRNSYDAGAGVTIEPRTSTTVNYGLDLGFKHTLQGRVSLRHAVTYRAGDNLAETYGVTSGISIFFR